MARLPRPSITMLTAAILAAVAATPATAQTPALAPSPQVPVLSYDLDASLIYFDALARPRTGVVAPQVGAWRATDGAAAVDRTRAFGLRRLRLAATWQAADSAGLRVVLRPDAVNRETEEPTRGEARELDTRAGDPELGSPYRSMPTVRLLDAYQLMIAPGKALSASFGVFEELAPGAASYPTLLGFGLETRLPAKFSGARLGWSKARAPEDTGLGGLGLELTFLQGNEDRAESRCSTTGGSTLCSGDDDSRDYAPAARDPYQGFAFGAIWSSGAGLGVNLLLGTYDTGVDTPSGGSGRITEVFGQTGIEWTRTLLDRLTKWSLDVRYARERWQADGLDVRPRVQNSARLTTAISAGPQAFALAGVAVGHSDQDPAKPATASQPLNHQVAVNGYQIELGYLAQIAAGLSLEAMLAHERRTVEDAAGTEVGAIYGTEGSAKTLRRMALGMNYALNGG